MKGRPKAPHGAMWDKAVAHWRTLRSDEGAHYDKVVTLDAAEIAPVVTWGTSPEDVLPITESIQLNERDVLSGGKALGLAAKRIPNVLAEDTWELFRALLR